MNNAMIMPHKRRVYISGPMRGIPEYNFPAFHAAAARWRQAGWEVVNPAESFDGKTDLPLEMYMRKDFGDLLTCGAIALLPGWEDSEGARKELLMAQTLALPVYAADSMGLKSVPQVETRLGALQPLHLGTVDEALSARSPDPLEIIRALPPLEPVVFPKSAPRDSALPIASKARKDVPLARGVLDYFPAALAEVARLSKHGNDKHNPGEDLHWARGKSMDHADCIMRHLVDRGTIDPDDGFSHTVKVAWRALALLQEELEEQGAPMPRGARRAS